MYLFVTTVFVESYVNLIGQSELLPVCIFNTQRKLVVINTDVGVLVGVCVVKCLLIGQLHLHGPHRYRPQFHIW